MKSVALVSPIMLAAHQGSSPVPVARPRDRAWTSEQCTRCSCCQRSGGPRQALGRPRHRDEVHVVRHEASGPDAHAVRLSLLGHQGEIAFVVGVGEERRQPPVAALRDVMRISRNDHPCKPCHALNLPTPRCLSTELRASNKMIVAGWHWRPFGLAQGGLARQCTGRQATRATHFAKCCVPRTELPVSPELARSRAPPDTHLHPFPEADGQASRVGGWTRAARRRQNG